MYFFDNNFSKSIVNILKELNVEAQHLSEQMEPSTPDEVWIPQIAANG